MIYICIFIALAGSTYAQQVELSNIFDIYFQQDFENDTPGKYIYSQFQEDFNYPSYVGAPINYGEVDYWTEAGKMRIIEENGNKFMRHITDSGEVGLAPDHGMEWHTPLDSEYEEVYFSYRLRFKPGFEPVLSGKLGGGTFATPKRASGQPPEYDEGYSQVLTWAQASDKSWKDLVQYIYHHDQQGTYGDSYRLDYGIPDGKWITITTRIVLNTVTDNKGNYDGICETFIDGVLCLQLTNFRLRNYESIKIDNLTISNFFGGSGDEFASIRDEYCDFDDFIVFAYKPGVDVPRGNVPSTSDRKLFMPDDEFNDAEWRKSLTAIAISSRTINLEWKNYFYPITYTIQRRTESETDFQDIVTLDFSHKSYTNTDLLSNTTYYYRIKAGNSISDPVSITTQPPLAPQAPSSLVSLLTEKTTAKIGWNDNSANEIGFIIEQSDIVSDNFRQIANVGPNVKEFNVGSLTPNTSYYFRVKAYNEDGESDYSDVLSLMTLPLLLPAAPSDLEASNVNENSCLLSWKDNSDNELGFQIYTSLSDTSGFHMLHTSGNDENIFVSDNLEQGNTYFYKVRSFNNDGVSAYTNTLKVIIPDLPESPASLIMKNKSIDLVSFEWTDNSTNETGFYLERSINTSDFFVRIDTLKANTHEFTDRDLYSNTSYYYRLTAFNDDGSSDYSDTLFIHTDSVIFPLPPSGLKTISITPYSVTISWNDNSSNETGFQIQRADESMTFTNLTSVVSDITQYSDSLLEENSTYYYRIKSYNDHGYIDFSDTLTVHTPENIIPPVPDNFKTDLVTYNKIVFSWDPDTTHINGFEIIRATDTSGYILVNRTGIVSTYTDTTIEQGTDYLYRIRAFNSYNYSPYSFYIRVSVPVYVLPETPELLSPANIESNTIAIKWIDKSTDESGFIIKRALYPTNDFKELFTSKPNDTLFVDKTVMPNTTYYYMVNAVNEYGRSKNSNKLRISSLSIAEAARFSEGIIAYYNFSLNSDTIIHDLSKHTNPVDLLVTDTMCINWTKNNRFEVLSNTIIRSQYPASKIIDACKKTNEITLECWIKPNIADFSNDATIISLSQDPENIGISLMQSNYIFSENRNYRYLLGLSTKSTESSGKPYLSTSENDFVSLHHIAYTKNKQGEEKIFLNGEMVATSLKPLGFDNWNNDYHLFLGNESTMEKPWIGMFYLIAIYNVALTTEEVLQNYQAGPTDNISVPNNNVYNLKLFPNPAPGRINIDISPTQFSDYGERIIIQLIDLNGFVCHEEVINDSNKHHSKELDLSYLQKGIYYFRLISASATTTEKIILY